MDRELAKKKKSDKKIQNFLTLLEYIEKEDIEPNVFLHVSKSDLNKLKKGKGNPSFFLMKRITKSFNNVDWKKVKKDETSLSLTDDLGFEQKTKKIRLLNAFLIKKGLTLARVLGISKRKYDALESGYTIPSKHILKKVSIYFSLPLNMLTDDKIILPKDKELKIDEDLAAIQRHDLSETINHYKNKHYLRRNF
ncbi:MAG: helix-turn-helix transcriptional regulator [Bacilli bacterium]